MSRARLIERLSWYYPTERFHAFATFPGLLIYAIYKLPIEETVLVSYGLLICIYILYQGQLYWKLKLYSLKNISFDQEAKIRFFKQSKGVNVILVCLIPLAFVVQLYLINWQWSNSGFWWGVLACVFGILEYINYYHTQLMIDNAYDWKYLMTNRRLKEASLAKDLKQRSF